MKLRNRPPRGKSSSPKPPATTPEKSVDVTKKETPEVVSPVVLPKKSLALMLQESSPRQVLDMGTTMFDPTMNAPSSAERKSRHNHPDRSNILRDLPAERILFPQDQDDVETQPPTEEESPEDESPMNISQSSLGEQIDVYGSMPVMKRRKKKSSSISALPTLSEASVEEGSEADAAQNTSFDSWDDGEVPFPSLEATAGMMPKFTPMMETRKLPKAKLSSAGPPGTKRTAAEKIQDYQIKAADHAARGLEEEAVQIYRKALNIGRKDVTRIKGQLKQVSTAKHHTAVAAKSISTRLHEDWMEIGVLIANVRNAQAMIYERLGVYDKAMTCCAEALAVYKRQAKFLKKSNPGSETSVVKEIQHMMETTQRVNSARESYERRKQAHEEIIAMRLELPTKPPMIRRQLYKDLQQKVIKVRKSETELLGPQHPQLGDTASLLGSLALEQGEKDKAIPYMMEAYSIMKQSLGMKHPRTGVKLLHIASIYNNPAFRQQKREEDLAIDFYKEAIQVFRASETCPLLLGSTLNDLAVLFIGRKDYAKAVELLQESLEAYDEAKEPDAPSASWDTAQVWLNLGECYNQQRDHEKAADAFMKALDVQRDGRKIFENALKQDGTVSGEHVPPAHLVDDRRIADTMRRLGKAYVSTGAHDKAMVFFKEACMIHKSEVKKAVQAHKGRDTTVLPSMQDELAQTIYCLAEVNDVTGKTEQAARLYSESLQLRLFSDAHKPKRTNMVHCAMCLNGLGSIHLKKSEYEEAQGVFKEALGYCSAHGVPASHPIVKMIEEKLKKAVEACKDDVKRDEQEARKLEKRAMELVEQDKLDSAILTLTSVMQLRKDVLKRLRDDGKDSGQSKYMTACTLKMFGEVLARKGDVHSAERAFKDSLKLFKKSGTKNTEFVVLQVCEELGKLQQVA